MAGSNLTSDNILVLLAESTMRIASLTIDLTSEQLRTLPSPNEWSARDVLAHLRSCADVWGDCIARMLAEEHPTIRAINPRTWIRRTNYSDLDFRPSFEAYATQRGDLLACLEELSPAQWLRSATVTGAGKTLVRTVQTVCRVVGHS